MDGPNPNPFGVVDHTAFAGFGVDLVWGLDRGGEAIHVSAARRGLACDLICPACKARLVARKGSRKAAHFAHQGRGSGCGSGRETNAHFWAKQLLVERKRIWTPKVTAVVDGVSREESAAKWMTFSDVRSERRLDRIVPDIVLILADGRELIVEICVTHPCGEDKIALIQERRWPAIEINLRRLRTSQNIAEIERGLLREAPRSWLCNPRRDRAEERLRGELADAAARRAAAAQRQAAREAEQERRAAALIEAEARELLRAITSVRWDVGPVADRALAGVIADDDGRMIGIAGAGAGFLASRDEWQATLYEQFIAVRDPRTFDDRTFSLDDALTYLEPLIAPRFGVPPKETVRAWLRRHHPEVRFPREAIQDYCEALCVAGGLQSEGGDHYGLPDDTTAAIKREGRRLRAIDARADIVHRLLDTIVADLPVAEAFDFEPQIWLATSLLGAGRSPDVLLVEGDALCDDLIGQLRALAAMAAGGEEAIDDLLGLPLAAARYRAIERKTTRRGREAAERSQRLRDAAARVLAEEAPSWLTRPFESADETPLALARGGRQVSIDASPRSPRSGDNRRPSAR
ncbi:competence protein CoiA family protein [Sphingomonas sp. GM_Shp_2]|uniref:competence protein CoiA family protein n=1 Tax=Sphingomonas sp. GM_Shp_2 TaxID=2937380 RepID=UPI00226A9737|nr:competence protein CoiA family protein [Sphingomonas sp. GM_Shp_2]